MMDITIAIDKLEKIGIEAVNAQLRENGISEAAVQALQPILSLSGSNRDKLKQLRGVIGASETGLKGIEEMETIFDYSEAARHFAGNRTRPVAGTGIELLYRGDLRGEIERFRDRKYLRRRTVRRPNGASSACRTCPV